MFTKIKLAFWLISWLRKLVISIEADQLQKRTERNILNDIDTNTLEMLADINRRRRHFGDTELRAHDEFERP